MRQGVKMNKRIRSRVVVILCVTLLCVYLFAGFPPSRAGMRDRIHLGLDLRGGVYLVLQVVTDDAVRAEADQAVETARRLLNESGVSFRQLIRKGTDQFDLIGVNSSQDTKVRQMVSGLSDWGIILTSQETSATYTIALKPARAAAIRDQSVDQAMNTIRSRIDQLGVTEPVIQKHGGPGSYEILVQLPGVDDVNRVKDIIQATALLELKLVDRGPFPAQSAVLQAYGGNIPENLEVLLSKDRGNHNATYYTVQHVASITGRDLKSAYPSRDENGHPAVTFSLTSDGSQRFARVTEENIGKQLAIVLDGKIQSAPAIHTRISDSGIIQGGPSGFSPAEAQDLSLILRSGSLPASLIYLQEDLIGPSLGADSIQAGMEAAAVALVVVVGFMLAYYRFSGLNAAVAMILNIVVLLGAMAYFGVTLTLPGIAGITLTIGVGIDSNVLIFERIREELRAGKTAVSAVAVSFDRVFVTLVDTHLAALISAMFLFLFGTGPVKGFAVTLVIGLVSNMFTSVFVSKTLFDWVLARQRSVTSISI